MTTLTVLGLARTVSAATHVGAENGVGASNRNPAALVGPPDRIAAGQRLGDDLPGVLLVVATAVAAKSSSGLLDQQCVSHAPSSKGWAGIAGASVGEVLVGGVEASGTDSAGGKVIWTVQPSNGVGLVAPDGIPPWEIHGGASYTKVG